MKKIIFPILLIFVVSTMYKQAKIAKVNENVWLVVYKVKADKRKQYEHFVHDIFWGGIAKLSVANQKVLHQTRILHPEKPEKDGT